MMNIENIKVGEMYKYRELCKLLGVKCQEGQNKRIELYEEFQRYFEYEKVNKQNFLIKIKHSITVIPKLIHYSWFSGEPFPAHIQALMETWKKQWNF